MPKRREPRKKAAAEPMPVDAPQPEVEARSSRPATAGAAPPTAREPATVSEPHARQPERSADPRATVSRDRERSRDRAATTATASATATRRDRYRRDDDLGPAVVGFGDDVPAFMLLRARAAAHAGTRSPKRSKPDDAAERPYEGERR